MPDYYGLPQAATGGVPAGGSTETGYFVIQAPRTKHLRIVALDMVGGDATEAVHLYIWPPGTTFPTPALNGVVWCSGTMIGGETVPFSLIQNLARDDVGFLVLPAGWSAGALCPLASPATAITFNVVGLPFDASE